MDGQSGQLWLFGGSTYNGNANDLWKYNTATGLWTWVNGSSITEQAGIYGTKGTASATSAPGARNNALSWTDKQGNFWMMGGYGHGNSQKTLSYLDDLWKYDPATNMWTWIAGSDTPPLSSTAAYGSIKVSSASNYPGTRTEAATWTDKDGNLWLMGGIGFGGVGLYNDLWKYDITTNVWIWMSGSPNTTAIGQYGTVVAVPAADNVPGSRINGYTWSDNQGNLWLFGGLGNGSSTANFGMLNDLWKYNITTGMWTWVGGSANVNQSSITVAKGYEGPGIMPGGREAGASMVDKQGNFWLMGGLTGDNTLFSVWNDLWRYNPATGNWAYVSGSTSANQAGVYGTKGTPSISNVPGARDNMMGWADNAGNLWIMAVADMCKG